jgi:nitrogen fixation/metabolism regulation signal transduction histidine kinase
MVDMVYRALKKLMSGVTPILVLVALLLTTLSLMGDATENSARFSEIYSLLLILNALGLVTLLALIVWNLVRLIGQVRARVAGARLTVRMVTMFVVLAVTPVLVVYYFSMQFLHRGIDSWFDVQIERALDDALELGRTSLDERMRDLLKQTESMAIIIGGRSDESASLELHDARIASGASELTLMAANGSIIASSSGDTTFLVPESPDEALLLHVRQSQSYAGLDPIGTKGLHIRVVIRVSGDVSSADTRILQALFPVSKRLNSLAESVQGAYADYQRLIYLREPLRFSFTVTLSLVLLLSAFASVWAAFFSANRMVAPLRDLVQGTRAVAEGDYETQLPQAGKDDIGFVVESFNIMTRRLARARDETRNSQQLVEDQRAYLEVVLSSLSSGVLTFDESMCLVTSNAAAEQILGVSLTEQTHSSLALLSTNYPKLAPLTDTLLEQLAGEEIDWRQQVTLIERNSQQVLLCRGTRLERSGHVIVFDDVTALIQAQRDAAWSEVARRLAHEIKNPLTPIQLSAERLRHKYLGNMPAEESELLDRLTRTIVQQVEAMKGMVNAFSDYARTPKINARSVSLNDLVSDVGELYRGANDVDIVLGADLPDVELDPDRVRQVLHNLIKNAVESCEQAKATVNISTALGEEPSGRFVEVCIADHGGGFPPEILERAFEPYVTTKPKGTGLGLAIVKRIVDEHGGSVDAENQGDGAVVRLRFPVAQQTSLADGETSQRKEAI